MIQVLLLILKIIGIALASIIGFVLFILLVVLFVPIRYRARVIKKPEHLEVTGRVSFLFSFLRVTVRYFEKLTYQGHIFVFKFLDSEKEKKPKRPKKKKQSKKEETIEQQEEPQLLSENEEQKKEELLLETTEKTEEPLEEVEEPTLDEVLDEMMQEEAESVETEKVGFFEKIGLKIEQIKNTIDKVIGKIRKIWHQKEEVERILEKERTKRAISFVFGKVVKILRHILPRKLKGYLIFGSGDPATTGKILAVLGVVYAKTGPLIDITPNFVEKQLECDLEIEGKIQIIVLVVIAVQIIMKKEVRQLIKDVKNIKNVQ